MKHRYKIARSLANGPAEASALVVTSKVMSLAENHFEKARTVNKTLKAERAAAKAAKTEAKAMKTDKSDEPAVDRKFQTTGKQQPNAA